MVLGAGSYDGLETSLNCGDFYFELEGSEPSAAFRKASLGKVRLRKWCFHSHAFVACARSGQ